ncbi:putative WRKY transcription factor 23, partial [Mucuna pruriens]
MENNDMMMGVKKEDYAIGSSSFPFFDFGEDHKSSVGFMELLGVQDYSPLLDFPPAQTSAVKEQPKRECSEVTNHQQPATPNSSSISSASSEALNDERNKTVDQAHEHQKTKEQLKVKKTNQKRQREARFAFMTKSEVDHLEDGYRWRKYGQKAVKNSPFPRSYYRCTSASCNVKKRVERSFTDPGIVVTTYEGQHTHPSPVMGRSNNFASVMPGSENYMSQYYQQQVHVNALSSLGFLSSSSATFPQETALLSDYGLLQDENIDKDSITALGYLTRSDFYDGIDLDNDSFWLNLSRHIIARVVFFHKFGSNEQVLHKNLNSHQNPGQR